MEESIPSSRREIPTDVIQSLWIGSKLSRLERLSIASFLRHGHEFHLYAYEEIADVPSGAKIRNAEEILPASRIFQYRENGSYAGFANFFRYRLLLEKGGWWVDTDVVCLRPFDFPSAHVFATEPFDNKEVVTAGIIRSPRQSDAIRHAWERCDELDPDALRWGETGSALVTELVEKFGLAADVVPPRCFCPIPYQSWQDVLDPAVSWNFDPETRAVHLWNEMWRRAGRDKNADYPPGCLYETLKGEYLSE